MASPRKGSTLDFMSIVRHRAKIAATRRPLPFPAPPPKDASSSPDAQGEPGTPGPSAARPPTPQPESTPSPQRPTLEPPRPAEDALPNLPDMSDVRWEKVHAVKNAIATGRYDVEGRLASLLERFAEAGPSLMSGEEE